MLLIHFFEILIRRIAILQMGKVQQPIKLFATFLIWDVDSPRDHFLWSTFVDYICESSSTGWALIHWVLNSTFEINDQESCSESNIGNPWLTALIKSRIIKTSFSPPPFYWLVSICPVLAPWGWLTVSPKLRPKSLKRQTKTTRVSKGIGRIRRPPFRFVFSTFSQLLQKVLPLLRGEFPWPSMSVSPNSGFVFGPPKPRWPSYPPNDIIFRLLCSRALQRCFRLGWGPG